MCYLRVPFHQLASPSGFHATHIPIGTLFYILHQNTALRAVITASYYRWVFCLNFPIFLYFYRPVLLIVFTWLTNATKALLIFSPLLRLLWFGNYVMFSFYLLIFFSYEKEVNQVQISSTTLCSRFTTRSDADLIPPGLKPVKLNLETKLQADRFHREFWSPTLFVLPNFGWFYGITVLGGPRRLLIIFPGSVWRPQIRAGSGCQVGVLRL